MTTIILYTLTSDRKCAKKSITQIRQVNCNLKMPTDISNDFIGNIALRPCW